ncbi:MAG TPA: sugar kinase [Flavitalea sp.]|nr:sugar kinase [Flavitalea sp.]
MKKVLCFGELLMRLSPQLQGEWIHQSSMPVYIGGAELNVAAALAKWNIPVRYCTAIPDHYLSREIIASLESRKIDTHTIRFSGKRIGLYWLPQGADLKNAGVLYDRDHSSFSELNPGDINWDSVLEGIGWFHFSAITPALNQSVALVCEQALKEAVKRNIFISVDLNYRSKLWQYGKLPTDIMPGLVQYCNCVMGNIWSAQEMLGIELPNPLQRSRSVMLHQAAVTSEAIIQKFPSCSQVANTFRFDEENAIRYYGALYNGNQLFASKEMTVEKIIDRVGTGDCFMAGLIYSMLHENTPQASVEFATAAACKKFLSKGDFTEATVEEIENQLK